jgi:hypothetical protein
MALWCASAEAIGTIADINYYEADVDDDDEI